jgi:hypothetical protein
MSHPGVSLLTPILRPWLCASTPLPSIYSLPKNRKEKGKFFAVLGRNILMTPENIVIFTPWCSPLCGASFAKVSAFSLQEEDDA